MSSILPNITGPAAPQVRISQTQFIVITIILSFLVYITARGELTLYLQLLF